MKRILIIRRRRYLARALTLGFAVALLLPAAALARYDDQGAGATVDLYASSGLSAEDVHGLSAVNGTYVLPQADQKAVEQATKPAVAPTVVSTPTVTTGSSVAWGQIALFSSLGLLGLAGILSLAMVASRRGPRVAHS